jgi:hypothetical protein
VRQAPEAERDREHAERHVDQEDPLPAERGEQPAAEHRAEHGRQDDRHADDRHDAPHVLRACGTREHHLADRQRHAAADTLENAKGDERLDGARRRPWPASP